MILALCAFLASPAISLTAPGLVQVSSPRARRPLDVAASDRWREIEGRALSRDGSWVLFTLDPAGPSDGVLCVEAVGSEAAHRIERGSSGRFDGAAEYVVAKLEPPREELRQAELEDKPKDERPKAGLALLHLASGARLEIGEVADFRVAEEGGSHFAWRSSAKPAKGSDKQGDSDKAESESQEEEEKPSKAERLKKEAKEKGKTLHLRRFDTPGEQTFQDVTHYVFSPAGDRLAYVVSHAEGEGDGVYLHELGDAEPLALHLGLGHYGKPVFSEDGTQLALVSSQPDYEADQPLHSLLVWRAGEESARIALSHDDERLPKDLVLSPHRDLRFSPPGDRLLVGLGKPPRAIPADQPAEDDVVVDVWSWTDGHIQPMQLQRLEQERERSFLAVMHVADERLVALASPERPDAALPRDGQSPRALVSSDLPYQRMLTWEGRTNRDVWSVDVETGEAIELLTGAHGDFQLSPGGNWVSWWDGEQRAWMAMSAEGGAVRSLTGAMDVAFHDEWNDRPRWPGSYGRAGWWQDDRALVVHDRYDLWELDPSGQREPVCLTAGRGRAQRQRLRFLDLDLEEEWLDPAETLLLSLFDEVSKENGYAELELAAGATGELRTLLKGSYQFGRPRRAEEGETLLFTRENWVAFPDLWASTDRFAQLERMSTANPQQAEYLWGGSRLVSWKSDADVGDQGEPDILEGILYTPEGFDPSRKYPLLVYFYERNSDNLHRHHSPVVSRSVVRFPVYTSRGYLVFVPDIPYQVGYPGRSSEDAVLSGVRHLVDQGFVDREAIGVQGHSWGGYQIAHLITRTEIFRAAVSGAPVSNMTSAYGGVRWASGMSRAFQYEKTQSRIGGTLWDSLDLYIENSPVFFADRVATPVVILHNDEDGAVPWYQGIEFFLALRRLDRPAWMLNYNGEGHGIGKYAHRKDYAVRMQQFFDHYLLGAPAPRWLQEGRPAVDKGHDLGLGLIEASSDR